MCCACAVVMGMARVDMTVGRTCNVGRWTRAWGVPCTPSPSRRRCACHTTPCHVWCGSEDSLSALRGRTWRHGTCCRLQWPCTGSTAQAIASSVAGPLPARPAVRAASFPDDASCSCGSATPPPAELPELHYNGQRVDIVRRSGGGSTSSVWEGRLPSPAAPPPLTAAHPSISNTQPATFMCQDVHRGGDVYEGALHLRGPRGAASRAAARQLVTTATLATAQRPGGRRVLYHPQVEAWEDKEEEREEGEHTRKRRTRRSE